MGAAGSGALSTGAERRRERDKKKRGGRLKWREIERGREGSKEGEKREREGHGGRPVGDYFTTWESCGLYTSKSAKNTAELTHTHIKIVQTERQENHVSNAWPVQKSAHAG